MYETFCALAGVDLPRPAALTAQIAYRELAAGEVLFRPGEVVTDVFVVLTGFLKLEYETAAGHSWIKAFVERGHCFASLTALSGGRTTFGASAGPSCTVAMVDYRLIDALAAQSPQWQLALCTAFKRYGYRKEQREFELLTLDAGQRYDAFLKSMPEVASQLKQHEIASYIRVTPVALSRIRARRRQRLAALDGASVPG